MRLRSYTLGGLPIINHILQRMNLEAILRDHLGPDDPRVEVSTASALLVLVRNILISREPIYGVGEWASRQAPELLGLTEKQLGHLNDDRLGRCLDRLFDTMGPKLLLAVVRQVIEEFDVRLDELHNDSTSLSFHGAYREASEEKTRRGRKTHAVTFGHSKDHRPDLKQVLYILTISDDGGVPVYFTSASGNVTDDATHCDTWQLLCELVGSTDFLYVADCKLATTDNMDHIARRGGRFITVLPRTRREDTDFRRRTRDRPQSVTWQPLYTVTDEQGRIVDKLSSTEEEHASAEGYRLFWFHSTRKAELDVAARSRRTQRALAELSLLADRLAGKRTRFRDRAKVEKAVREILERLDVGRWVSVTIHEHEELSLHQASPGRPGKDTKYLKKVKMRYRLTWQVDATQLIDESATDGLFPLITNARDMDAEAVLRAYKRQPVIEKRFSQLKTDFEVAPVYLKEVSRIQSLLCIYFLVLLVQSLLERELRQGMERSGIKRLPLYPEDRPCRRPTTRRVLDLFEPLERHELTLPDGSQEHLFPQLTPLQRQLLRLLHVPTSRYAQ
ncbi:MAG: IS1634 family transposase [Gemmatimonadales bacterium]